MRISAVVLNWKRPAETIECVGSIRETAPGVDVIVVDNASGDDSLDWLAATGIHAIENEENLGYTGGNNVGIRAALAGGADAVLVLNNDLTVGTGCVDDLRATMEQFPRTGIAAPLGLLKSDPSIVDFWRAEIDLPNMAVHAIGRDEPVRGWTTPEPTDYATGSAMLVRREVFDRIGLFDERFFLVWEDVDFSLRGHTAGFDVLAVPKAQVLHARSVSFGGEGAPLYQYFYVRNSFLIAHKHARTWRRGRTKRLLERRYQGWIEQSSGPTRRAIELGLQHARQNRFGPPPEELFGSTDS